MNSEGVEKLPMQACGSLLLEAIGGHSVVCCGAGKKDQSNEKLHWSN
jgi:hypothetical protein